MVSYVKSHGGDRDWFCLVSVEVVLNMRKEVNVSVLHYLVSCSIERLDIFSLFNLVISSEGNKRAEVNNYTVSRSFFRVAPVTCKSHSCCKAISVEKGSISKNYGEA